MPSNDLVVYTASFGKKDYLIEPSTKGEGAKVDYICFTDDPEIGKIGGEKCPHWQIRVMDRLPQFKDKPRHEAKYYKVNSHEVLPEYKASLWLDCNIELRDLRDG